MSYCKLPVLSLGNLKRIVGERGDSLLFAMNGGMYKGDSMPVVGLYVENGKAISPMAKLCGDGNFNMRYGREASNGVFTISRSGHAMVVKSRTLLLRIPCCSRRSPGLFSFITASSTLISTQNHQTG